MSRPMFSVIMPVWIQQQETLFLTSNALNSIRETGEKVEMIIIDNGSGKGAAVLREEADVYIRFQKNLGYPKAVNYGFRVAGGRYLAVANNDIRVSENIFKESEEVLELRDDIGSVHFRMVGYDEQINLGNRTWVTGKERWCSSSFFIIRKKAVPKGLFDERFGLGGYDDVDFWLRVRDNGWKTAYTNKACYRHLHSHTQILLDNKDRGSRQERDKRNFEYFTKKWRVNPDQALVDRYPDQMVQDYWGFFDEF